MRRCAGVPFRDANATWERREHSFELSFAASDTSDNVSPSPRSVHYAPIPALTISRSVCLAPRYRQCAVTMGIEERPPHRPLH